MKGFPYELSEQACSILVDYVQLDTQSLTLSSFGILQIKQFYVTTREFLKKFLTTICNEMQKRSLFKNKIVSMYKEIG